MKFYVITTNPLNENLDVFSVVEDDLSAVFETIEQGLHPLVHFVVLNEDQFKDLKKFIEEGIKTL